MHPLRRTSFTAAALAATVLACTACADPAQAAGPAASGSGFSAGLEVRPSASEADIGLAVYPGAQPRRDGKDDSTGVTLGLWGGMLGMHLQVLKYSSGDGVDRIGGHYRNALAAYGPLLDCSARRPSGGASGAQVQVRAGSGSGADASRKKVLSCDDDQPDPGGRLYKAGTPDDQRIVSIKPAAGGQVEIDVVHLRLRHP